jgi:hypothetical protein
MTNLKRAVAAVSLGTALLGFLASPASAVPDPSAVLGCAPTDVTGLVDPASPGVPTEVPLTSCLAP